MDNKIVSGPWWASRSGEIMSDPMGIIKIARVHAVSANNDGSGNAALIAAAPELLDAIKYYFDVLAEAQGAEWNKHPDHVLKKMINAVKKAEGGAR